MEAAKPPLQPKPLRRKVHVVYYLSRGGGQMDHPHLLEGYLSTAQDGLRLRDFKRWLAVLRGKSMPSSYSWSYKRTYKNGFIWHDLGENDLIQPLSKNEYVLMGSEIKEQQGVNVGKCKCGAMQQQIETKVTATKTGCDNRDETSNKPVLRTPKLDTRSSSHDAEDHRTERVMSAASSPAGLGLITTENKFHDNGTRMMHKSRGLYRGGGSSRSFNDLTAQRLLEEVKRPNTNHHDSKHPVTIKNLINAGPGPSIGRTSIRDRDIISEDGHIAHSEDMHSIGMAEAARRQSIDYMKSSLSCGHVKRITSTSIVRGDRYKESSNEEHGKHGVADDNHDHDNDVNGAYIMDAATQTGDSTRCSTEDHQEGITSDRYNIIEEIMDSPRYSSKFSPSSSARLSSIRKVSSARFNNSHNHHHAVKGNLSLHLSQEFCNLPDTEKSIMTHHSSEIEEIRTTGSNTSLSNHISLHNHIASPGTLSSCSAMSARSSTRFAREESGRITTPAAKSNSAKKHGVKPEPHHQHHHRDSKGSCLQCSSNAPTSATGSSSSAPHTLLKQILTCGNADVVSEKKPNNSTVSEHNVMVISNNALSGLHGTTPSRAISTATHSHDGGDKSRNLLWAACKPGGLMKKMSSAASSENRSVISATASEQGSVRDHLDTLEMISSPESAYFSSSGHRQHHLKSNMIKAHSLSTSSAAAALRSASSHLHRSAAAPTTEDASFSASRTFVSHYPPSRMAADHPSGNGNTSPGVLSVASSTSTRRSSIRESEVNTTNGGDVEEGFQEALRSHQIGVRVRSKSKVNKEKRNNMSIIDILEEPSYKTCELEMDANDKREAKPHSTTVSELHKLICNPIGAPTCDNHNKSTSTNLVLHLAKTSSCDYDQPNDHNNIRSSHTPKHSRSHQMFIGTHGSSRIPTKLSKLNSRNISILSKSLNSPSSSIFLEERTQTPSISSSYISSWKDLLWSPRNNSSHKEKEKRQMKP